MADEKQINPQDVINKWSRCTNSFKKEENILPVISNDSNVSSTHFRRKLAASSLKSNRKVNKGIHKYQLAQICSDDGS